MGFHLAAGASVTAGTAEMSELRVAVERHPGTISTKLNRHHGKQVFIAIPTLQSRNPNQSNPAIGSEPRLPGRELSVANAGIFLKSDSSPQTLNHQELQLRGDREFDKLFEVLGKIHKHAS